MRFTMPEGEMPFRYTMIHENIFTCRNIVTCYIYSSDKVHKFNVNRMKYSNIKNVYDSD